LVFLPMMIVGAALTPFIARIAQRFGPRTLICAGLTLMAVGLAVLATFPETVSVWALATLMVPVGLAGPLIMPPITALLLNSVPDAQAGTASGVFNTSRQVGGALAVAVFGALIAGNDFMHGLRLSLLIAAVAALTAAGIAVALRNPGSAHVTDHALLEGLA
jgi:sugar phosphate permease